MGPLWRTLTPALLIVASLTLLVPPAGATPTHPLAVAHPSDLARIPSSPGAIHSPVPPLGYSHLEGRALPHPGIVGNAWFNASPALTMFAGFIGTNASPPHLVGDAMASVPGSFVPYTVLYGGFMPNGGVSNQTWIYFTTGGPSMWANITNDSNHPPALAYPTLTYDPRIPAVVLFGGAYADGTLSNQTWLFNTSSGAWTNDSVIACIFYCPGAREGANMVFAGDSLDYSTILFGGCTQYCAFIYNDTWNYTYMFGNWFWTPISSLQSPSARYGAQMVYGDTGTGGYTWLFGGCDGFSGSCTLNDTWYYVDSQWYNFSFFLSAAPEGRAFGLMTYYAAGSALLLTGGMNDSNPQGLVDTWEFSCALGCAWYNDTAVAGGVQDVYGAISSNSTGTEPVAFGGYANGISYPSDYTYGFTNYTAFGAFISTDSPEVNQPVTFNATLYAGPQFDAAFSIWNIYPASGPGIWLYGNSSASFPTNGTWTISVLVFDIWDYSVLFTGPLFVGQPTVTLTASTHTTDVGIPVDFTSVAGGKNTAPLNFSWRFGDGSNATQENLSHAYAAPGNYTAVVLLNDLYANATDSVVITVHPLPSVTVTATPSLAGTVDAHQSVTFAAHVTNGTPGFTYSWAFGDGSASSTAVSPVHNYSAAGNYTVNLTVTDSVGGSAVTHVVVHVLPVLSATAAANLTSAKVGASITFIAEGSGGTGTYTYAWNFGDGIVASTATASHAYSAAGNFTAEVWVNDTSGASVERSVSVSITKANPGGGGNPNGNQNSSGSGSGIPSWIWIVLLIVVIVAVLGAVLMLRGRKTPPTPPPVAPPTGPSPGAPPSGPSSGGPPPGAMGGVPPTGNA